MNRNLEISLAALAAAVLTACQPPPSEAQGQDVPPASDEVGTISLQLTLSSQYQFHSIHYDISGVAFHTGADVDVDSSSAFATVVGGVPFGHYTATLTAQDASGKLQPCTGSAPFDVTSAPVVSVAVAMSCHEVPTLVPAVPLRPGAALAIGILLLAFGGWRLRGVRTLAVALALAVGVSACDADPAPGDSDTTVTGARMALDVAPGIALDSIAYQIVGPASFAKAGTIDVSQSTTLSASIAPLPPGTGFMLNMNATARDGESTCMGSAGFAVVAHQTTLVPVHMLCRQVTHLGASSFQGMLNLCPLIDSVGASPSEIKIGGSIELSAIAHDADLKPSPLAFLWTASAGTLANPTAQNAQLTCTGVGPITLTLTVNDGDNTPGCPDTQSIQVSCTPAGAP